jgi:hypothetical protein
MNIKEIGSQDCGLIPTGRGQSTVMVMNLRVLEKAGNFLAVDYQLLKKGSA